MEFGRLIEDRWEGETLAVSEKKAKSNLAYRYKKETGRAPGSNITLPGKLTEKKG
jgi:hypothetical protein